VFIANPDAHRRQVIDEEINPVVGRYDDQKIGPRRAKPGSDFVKPRGNFAAVVARVDISTSRRSPNEK
jgi:hypothetical protein